MKKLLITAFITIVAMAATAGAISAIWGYETSEKFRYGFIAVFLAVMGYSYYKFKNGEK